MKIGHAVSEKSRAQNLEKKNNNKQYENNKIFRWKRKTLTRHDLVASNEEVFRLILEFEIYVRSWFCYLTAKHDLE